MFVDDIYVGVIGEDGGDQISFFEAVVGGSNGRSRVGLGMGGKREIKK